MKIGRCKIELIIFDMDGLMFDTEGLALMHWKEAGEKFDYKIGDKIFKKTIGLKLTETEEVYKEHYGAGFPFEKIKNERKMDKSLCLSEKVFIIVQSVTV